MRSRRSALHLALVGLLTAGSFVAVGGATAAAPHAKAAKPKLSVRGSAREVLVTGVAPKAKLALLAKSGERVAAQPANSLGGAVFYHVRPGHGYRVKVVATGKTSKAVTVHTNRSKPWDPEIYKQKIPYKGYGYMKMRDGTKLAYAVHPPTQPASLGTPPVTLPVGIPDYAPPYPTLIEYAGYGYAQPKGPESGIAVLANLMGFAVVDVNMRGTGCSGGAYNFFEPLQNLDGYDIVETVAHQPWVKGHKVGMMGISFGAISQLFTAQTHPPSLEAIAPLSTIDATATTLYPGGVLNDGFAVAWANERQQNAEPGTGPHRGQRWAWDRIKAGDKTCEANQVLHGDAHSLPKKIARNSHYRPKVADPLDPISFVHKIHVPVFMACQFEDEQTGGHCPDLAQHFTGTKQKWFTFTNGAHIDSLDPETYNRWYDFLNLFVAHQAPAENLAVTEAAAPIIYQQAMGLPQDDMVTLPPDPVQSMPTYSTALAEFKKQPQVRVLFDNGAGSSPTGDMTPGNPYPGFEASFKRFPVPHTVAQRWYLNRKGTLSDTRATKPGINWYTSDAHALPLNNFTGGTGGGGLWGNASQWSWDWKPNPAGNAVSYISAPLKQDTTVVGAGAIDLWVRSSTPDVDLQATISEVDPGNHETYVQNGWIRASERKLAKGKNTIFKQRSTPLAPIPSLRAADVKPMPKGKFVKVAVPLYYEGHAYRAGTQIRITIAAPNGSQPIWSFSHTEPATTSKVSIAFSKSRPSSLILPVVPGVDVPTDVPPCPSLRNEPCRDYQPTANQVSKH
ncbi:MAG: CocE/NonD family hydrolase [Frankiaceae bacterium]|nr:CocE/NonD family hydrolase [Frankiaceae bacterium]